MEFEVEFHLDIYDCEDDDPIVKATATEDPDYVPPAQSSDAKLFPDDPHISLDLKKEIVQFWRSPQSSAPAIKRKKPQERRSLKTVQSRYRFVTHEKQLYRCSILTLLTVYLHFYTPITPCEVLVRIANYLVPKLFVLRGFALQKIKINFNPLPCTFAKNELATRTLPLQSK